MPVPAVIAGGRPTVSSGSRITCAGIILGWKMIFLVRVARLVMTPARPTSEPVPAVVGTATIGAMQPSGKRHALYEPIHGSAPDIAGKGIANPSAQILSFAMLLRLSFGMEEDAALLEKAVENVLAGGLRTADIMAPGMARVGTSVMGEAVLRELDKLSG